MLERTFAFNKYTFNAKQTLLTMAVTSTQALTTALHVPAPLRSYTDEEKIVHVTGETVGTALRDLVSQHPELEPHLYDENDALRSFVNIYQGDEDIRHLNGEETPLDEEEELFIIPSIAGGVCWP